MPPTPLTDCPFDDRDLTILQLTADGHTIRHTAVIMRCRTRTIDCRLYAMRQQTGVRGTTHLVATAIRRGWIK